MAAQRDASSQQQQHDSSLMTQAPRKRPRRQGADERHAAQAAAPSAKPQRGAGCSGARQGSSDAVLATSPAQAAPVRQQPAAAEPDAQPSGRSRPRRAAAPAQKVSSGAPTHRDRRHHVPPPDHHAEGKTAAMQPSAPPAQQQPGRQRRRGRAAPSASDSDASPPRRPRSAPAATDDDAAPSGTKTLFSPVFSLSGGKSAAELPPEQQSDATAAELSPAVHEQRSGTPPPRGPPDAATRPPVCSPAKGGPRSKLDPQQQQQCDPGSEDEMANSENDTQIRLSSAPGMPSVDSLASASDADSNQALGHDTLTLLCAGEPVVPDTSDDEEAQEHGGALQPLPGYGTAPAGETAAAEEDYDEEYMDFDPYLFIRKLPPLSSVVTGSRHLLLPRQTRASKRKTLVLDLDETLVHSSLDQEDRPHFTFPVAFGGKTHSVSVRRRPHLSTFLERVSQLFEVVVFTASQKVYAEQLLNVLDPERKLIRHRIFRDSCVYVEGNYLKDLSVLGRDLADTIIIDNSPQAFGYQLANGIPIESWYDDEEDCELLTVLPFLETLVKVPDVRPLIAAAYKLRERVARAPSPDALAARPTYY